MTHSGLKAFLLIERYTTSNYLHRWCPQSLDADIQRHFIKRGHHSRSIPIYCTTYTNFLRVTTVVLFPWCVTMVVLFSDFLTERWWARWIKWRCILVPSDCGVVQNLRRHMTSLDPNERVKQRRCHTLPGYLIGTILLQPPSSSLSCQSSDEAFCLFNKRILQMTRFCQYRALLNYVRMINILYLHRTWTHITFPSLYKNVSA